MVLIALLEDQLIEFIVPAAEMMHLLITFWQELQIRILEITPLTAQNHLQIK